MIRTVLTGAALAGAALGCAPGSAPPPNILWIVWDTVRADRLGLYGHEPDTTPNLTRWARTGRVFECSSVAGWTIPAHASMLTGLYPVEHGMSNHKVSLAPDIPTAAELLRERGYQTYAWSANPLVSRPYGTTRGFEVEEHPYDAELAERAIALVLGKLGPADRSSPLSQRLRSEPSKWSLLAVGELANERLLRFLDARDPERPFFGFLNLMEAHKTRIPRRRFRERAMGPADVEASYRVDLRENRIRGVFLGFADPFTPEEQRVVEGLYDAAILELDALLDALFRELEARDLLASTAIFLVSDHGEELGERGRYMHQYSLYEEIVRVPLVVWAPGRLAPGREPVPVSNIDLFATVLELAGVPLPPGREASSLLRPEPGRTLVAEYLEPWKPLLRRLEERYPDRDASSLRQQLRVLRDGPHKLLWRSADGPALFDLARDPGEQRDLARDDPARLHALGAKLDHFVASHPPRVVAREHEPSAEELLRLQGLGYLPADDEHAEDEPGPER